MSLPSASFHELLPVVQSHLQSYLERAEARGGRVITLESPEALARELEVERWIAEGGMDAQDLDGFLQRYLDGSTCLHHPGYIGHQVAAPMTAASMADLINGVTNNGMAVHEMGPPAVALELAIVDWMCGHVGFPEGCGGVLTHGGSLANLTALLAARAAIAPKAWQEGVPSDLVLVASEAAHYSIARSAAILGIGADAVRTVPVLADGTMDAGALPEVLDGITAAGKRVMAVVANACNTATGNLDDLAAIGTILQDRGIWFHVDAAHGASALLSIRHREALRGIELASSVIWDAHKMLHTSALCAAVLVRREEDLAAAFHQDPSYLGNPGFAKGPDLFHRAIECTKVPLGLKVFLNLAIHGEKGIVERLDHLYAMAHQAADLFRDDWGFEVPLAPQTNILLFRVGDAEQDQRALRSRLMEEGDFYITAAQ
ncbi:MAG: pyridoxal phosphate-dependent decarboxylase family protein, partial [Planctomycetota bacterium]